MALEHRYDPVLAEDSPNDVGYSTAAQQECRVLRARSQATLQILPWLITAVTLIVLAAATTKQPSEKQCIEKLFVWSPAREAIEYEDVKFQNSFNEKSAYRGQPTIELEKAWLDLWNFGPVNIPFDKLDALNKSSDATWQRSKQETGGGVIGSLEVFHQLHCLDFVRQYTYRDDYNYSHLPAFDGTPHQVRHHVDHCINSLRIYLQCTADITPYLILRDPKKPLGIDPDFCTQHKCRNFGKIQQWARDHELDTQDYQHDVEKPG